MAASINRIALLSGMMMMIYIYIYIKQYIAHILQMNSWVALSSLVFCSSVRPTLPMPLVTSPRISTLWCLIVSCCFSPFLIVSCCFSLFLAVSHCFLLFLVVSRRFSLFLVVSRCFWSFLIVSCRFSLFLANFRHFSSILVNSRKFLSILVVSRRFSSLLSVSHCFSSYSYVIVFGGLDALNDLLYTVSHNTNLNIWFLHSCTSLVCIKQWSSVLCNGIELWVGLALVQLDSYSKSNKDLVYTRVTKVIGVVMSCKILS